MAQHIILKYSTFQLNCGPSKIVMLFCWLVSFANSGVGVIMSRQWLWVVVVCTSVGSQCQCQCQCFLVLLPADTGALR